MKTKKRIAAIVVTTLLTVGMTLNFSGCSKESTMGPSVEKEQSSSAFTLSKGKGSGKGNPNNTGNEPGSNAKGSGKQARDLAANTYPQSTEMTLCYDQGIRGYCGGTMKLANGSQFHVDSNVLIPANGNGVKKPVTITMQVNKIENSKGMVLEFTFGPSGTQFSVPAEIRLDWTDLRLNNNQEPEFYYIDKFNNYIKQNPDQVDKGNRKVVLCVDHFSRYALAHSE